MLLLRRTSAPPRPSWVASRRCCGRAARAKGASVASRLNLGGGLHVGRAPLAPPNVGRLPAAPPRPKLPRRFAGSIPPIMPRRQALPLPPCTPIPHHPPNNHLLSLLLRFTAGSGSTVAPSPSARCHIASYPARAGDSPSVSPSLDANIGLPHGHLSVCRAISTARHFLAPPVSAACPETHPLDAAHRNQSARPPNVPASRPVALPTHAPAVSRSPRNSASGKRASPGLGPTAPPKPLRRETLSASSVHSVHRVRRLSRPPPSVFDPTLR